MKRTLLIASLVGTFALGWTLGLRDTPTVDAAPKPTCKDNLAKANAEVTRLTAELARRDTELQALLERERERVRALEAKIGKTAPGAAKLEPKKLQPIQKLD